MNADNILSLIEDSNASPRPRRVLLYGTHGIGKSTWAAMAPSPVFIRTEDGLRDIAGAKTFPLCKSIGDVCEQIQALKIGEHAFQTLAIDSADWLEQLIMKFVCDRAGKDSIAEVGGGFGRGETQAADMYRYVLSELADLNEHRAMTVILIAHCKVERFENPTTEAYDRYTPKLDKRINSVVQEWADEVLFANYKVYTRTDGKGFEERKLATGSGERVLYTTEKPGHLAKNRLALPDELPLLFSEYWKHVVGG